MGKRRPISNAGNMEIHLPIPIIHHIQSFLTTKQAARTTLVSKSWHDAWLTRTDLYFNQTSFHRSSDFWAFVDNTMQRYQQLNLTITSFKLHLLPSSSVADHSNATQLIKKAMKLCVNGFECPFEVLFSTCDFPSAQLSSFRYEIERPLGGKVDSYRLKSLRFENVHIDDDLFSDGFPPCLENLGFVNCSGTRTLEISSTSLKCISILDPGDLKFIFCVPNLRKLICSGPPLPPLYAAESSEEWEAEITVKHLQDGHTSSWFRRLKRIVKNLSRSMCKISLTIEFYGYCCSSHLREYPLQSIPKVENLMLSLTSQFHGYDHLLLRLFRSCRPKCIIQYWFPKSGMEENPNNTLIKILYDKLILGQAMYGAKKVNAEIFEETLGKWTPLHLEILLNDSKGQENKRKIRFLLEWDEVRED